MKVIHWKSEIAAPWKRALELKDFRMIDQGLHVEIEEESGRSWKLDFNPVQAWRVTSEECAGNLIAGLPVEGSLFLVRESEWRRQLGDAEPVQKSEHFVVCCYDEVIEVLAWNCSISPVTR
jgi:hypothetical protein